ncbi:hypothetical protein ECDEC13B_4766 [Escherichia coli DEC13B]|nr:hypothetical protein ECDEC13A_1617 [Escherichia coli DEC13A]EHX54491.1 hypothetical protein ECDEC13B_4766 [Escherichia coli DEC13B]
MLPRRISHNAENGNSTAWPTPDSNKTSFVTDRRYLSKQTVNDFLSGVYA